MRCSLLQPIAGVRMTRAHTRARVLEACRGVSPMLVRGVSVGGAGKRMPRVTSTLLREAQLLNEWILQPCLL